MALFINASMSSVRGFLLSDECDEWLLGVIPNTALVNLGYSYAVNSPCKCYMNEAKNEWSTALRAMSGAVITLISAAYILRPSISFLFLMKEYTCAGCPLMLSLA
jgi:hypothetical protein